MAAAALVGYVWTTVDAALTKREMAYQAAQQRCEDAPDTKCQEVATAIRAAVAAEDAASFAAQQLWLNLLGLVGLAATVFVAALAWQEAKRSADADNEALKESRAATAAANKSLQLTEEASRLQLRPYVFFASPEAEDSKPLTYDGKAAVALKNFGQTPAYGIKITRGHKPVKRPIGEFVVPLKEEVDLLDLAPGQSLTLYYVMRDLPEKGFLEFIDPDNPWVMVIRLRAEYEVAPGATASHDITFLLCEEAAYGQLPLLSTNQRGKGRPNS